MVKKIAAMAAILFAVSGPKTFAAAFNAAEDHSPHKVRFVTVEKGVKLEVLDWGGSGRPLVFLAGLGDTAHEFDRLALEFVRSHHVYAITRRGYGNSSKPPPTLANYSTARLGSDVLAAIGALGLKRSILAGHSLAGEELSWIGTNHPNRISGLIYLDAGYSYAYYAPGGTIPLGTNLLLSGKTLDSNLRKLQAPGVVNHGRSVEAIMEGLHRPLSNFEKDLSATQHAL